MLNWLCLAVNVLGIVTAADTYGGRYHVAPPALFGSNAIELPSQVGDRYPFVKATGKH
jgi:hypothetical protein